MPTDTSIPAWSSRATTGRTPRGYERYVQTPAGSVRHRLSPDDATVANLFPGRGLDPDPLQRRVLRVSDRVRPAGRGRDHSRTLSHVLLGHVVLATTRPGSAAKSNESQAPKLSGTTVRPASGSRPSRSRTIWWLSQVVTANS